MILPFIKMHGLGNDFMVIDTRGVNLSPDELPVRDWACRRTGIGFDQLVLIEPPQNPNADVFMRIRNRDGSMAETCGNALRCVAKLLCAETDRDECVIETLAGISKAVKNGENYTINMGKPVMGTVRLGEGSLKDPVTVDIGNPHAVFFVADAQAVDLETLGPRIETHRLFPNKINVEIAEITDRSTIRMRVWERGAGITGACGTGAAAVMAAAVSNGLVDSRAEIHLDGGVLSFEYSGQGSDIFMSGSASLVYKGEIEI